MSAALLTSKTINCCPLAWAAACTSRCSSTDSAASSCTNMAMIVPLGVSWRKISSRFVASAPETWLTPVTLPLGRFRLATRPSLTGSLPVTNKIGTVVVAFLAASAASTLATMTFTGRRTSSSTSAGSRSI